MYKGIEKMKWFKLEDANDKPFGNNNTKEDF